MPTNYSRIARNVPVTTQNDPRQIKNDDGGFVFQAGLMERLERFLILGAEGSTYYVSHQEHVLRNVQVVKQALAQDGIKAVELAEDVSVRGRAVKQDAGLYVIAEALKSADVNTRKRAAQAALKMARTGSTWLNLISYIGKERGTGKIVRGMIGNWYNGKSGGQLAYQVAKYANRANWTHADVIRRGHVKARDENLDIVFKWLLHDSEKNGKFALEGEDADYLRGYDSLRGASEVEALRLIEKFNFTHDMIPSEVMTKAVWQLLLDKGMAITALIRNLGSMTSKGLLDDHSTLVKVVEGFSQERITKGRVHPMTIYQAMKVYGSGKGVRGKLTWNPKRQVMDALNQAFYWAFGNVQKSNKRVHVALDHSMSMQSGNVLGMPDTTPAQASVAMAAILAHQFPYATFTTFGQSIRETQAITPSRRLDDIESRLHRIGEGTNFSVPIEYHARKNLGEVLIMFTDGQVNVGRHPHEEIARMRSKCGNVRVVLAITEANDVAIKLDDPYYLGIAGFDSTVPQILDGFLG